MSRQRFCEVVCDAGLSSDCYEQSDADRTIGGAIRKARAAGWHIGPASATEDACPTCWIAIRMETRYGHARPGSNNMQSS